MESNYYWKFIGIQFRCQERRRIEKKKKFKKTLKFDNNNN